MQNSRHSNWKYLAERSLSFPTCSEEEEAWAVVCYPTQAQGVYVCVSQGCITGKKADGATANIRIHWHPLYSRMLPPMSSPRAAIIHTTSKTYMKRKANRNLLSIEQNAVLGASCFLVPKNVWQLAHSFHRYLKKQYLGMKRKQRLHHAPKFYFLNYMGVKSAKFSSNVLLAVEGEYLLLHALYSPVY